MKTFKQFLQEATDARKARKEQNNHKNLLIRLAAVQAGGGPGIYGDTEETLQNKIKLAQHGIDLYGGANKTQAGIHQDEPTQHPDFHSTQSNTENGITTTRYVHDQTGVNSFIHTKGDVAYWGYNIHGSDKPMSKPEGMTDDEFKSHKKLTSDTSLSHLADFAKNNPHIRTITYQVDDTEQGRSNDAAYQRKYVPYLKDNHDVDLVRVEKNPLREPNEEI